MTPRLGVIEWMSNTAVLKDMVLSDMSRDELERSSRDTGPQNPRFRHQAWIDKFNPAARGKHGQQCVDVLLGGRYLQLISVYGKIRVDVFESIKDRCAPRVCCKAGYASGLTFAQRFGQLFFNTGSVCFIQLNKNPTFMYIFFVCVRFLAMRSHFERTTAVISVCHYILGIGDRHLSNFMIDTLSFVVKTPQHDHADTLALPTGVDWWVSILGTLLAQPPSIFLSQS